MDRDRLLDAAAELGGTRLDAARAADALAARLAAADALDDIRRIPLAFVDAVEPGHHRWLLLGAGQAT